MADGFGVAGNAGNRILHAQAIANEALVRLKHELRIPRLCAHNLDQIWATGKIGQKATILKPYRIKVNRGRDIGTDDEDMVDQYATVSLDTRLNFSLNYNDEEMTFTLRDFGSRYVQPGVEEMAYAYDEDGGEELAKAAAAWSDHTAPGTAMTLSRAAASRAHGQMLAIPQNRSNFCLMDPYDVADVGEAIRGLSDGSMGMIAESIRETYSGKLNGWHVFQTVNLPYLEVATYAGTPRVNGANQVGSSIVTDGWSGSVGDKVLNKGQMIKIAGVRETKPRGNLKPTGNDMTFTVLEDVVLTAGTGATNRAATIKIGPDLNDGTLTIANGNSDGDTVSLKAYQNVTAKPADNAAITIVGDSGASYRQQVWFERNAVEYVNVRLKKLTSIPWYGQAHDPQTGLSVTMMRDANIRYASERTRADAMFGVTSTYRELSMRSFTRRTDQ